jgi:hypothetical protein
LRICVISEPNLSFHYFFFLIFFDHSCIMSRGHETCRVYTDPFKYISWDGFHLTDRANELIVQGAFNKIITQLNTCKSSPNLDSVDEFGIIGDSTFEQLWIYSFHIQNNLFVKESHNSKLVYQLDHFNRKSRYISGNPKSFWSKLD